MKGHQFVQNVLTGGEANRRLAVITYGDPDSSRSVYRVCPRNPYLSRDMAVLVLRREFHFDDPGFDAEFPD